MLDHLSIAVVHPWVVHVRGGERAFFEIARALPQADLFLLHYRPGVLPPDIARRVKGSTFLQALPLRYLPYRAYLPLLPTAVASIPTGSYDLVISSSSGWVHGVECHKPARHICYMYSPPRYLWGEPPPTRLPKLVAGATGPLIRSLRKWDAEAARRVDRFIAISAITAQRIGEHYGRNATIVYPPVDIGRFERIERRSESYAICVGELVPYKRFDLAVLAARRAKQRLVIVGDGPSRRSLERLARGGDIQFAGRVSDKRLEELLAHASVLVHPGVEDFGINMVEAMAAGIPVITNARGGGAEIVDGSTGLLVEDESNDGFAEALVEVRSVRWETVELRRRAARFGVDRFHREFNTLVEDSYHSANGG